MRATFSRQLAGSRQFAALLAGAAAVLAFAGCQQSVSKPTARAPVPVTIARVTAQNVPTQLQAIGAVKTVSTVAVKSLVGGQLRTVEFKQGDTVRKGQVLFTIDPQPYEAALAQAQANLARDMANNSQAQLEAHRYADLAKQGIVSVEENEQRQSAAAADAAIVSADQAAVQSAKLNLSYGTITSPIDGRTGSLLVQAGNVVQANTTILVTINQISPIYVAFSVPEQYLLELKKFNASHALPVQAQAQGNPHMETGELSFINNSIDSSTGTIELMATFPNQDQSLWPGEYVNTDVTLAVARNATVVPSTAVLTGNDGMYVYVLQPNRTVEDRAVTIGTIMNGFTVITKGLTPGETVVTDGQLSLAPGSEVLVKQASADVAGASSAAMGGATAQ
ncbi:MAG TPA: efflux RND transporter periplasmic adaptor subunit [Terriglobales bacterium]|jgi:multidrug efflux system membrane fusion protein